MDIIIISLINAAFLLIGIWIGDKVKPAIQSGYEQLAYSLRRALSPKIKVFQKNEVKSVEEQQLADINKHHEQDRIKS